MTLVSVVLKKIGKLKTNSSLDGEKK